MLLQQRLAYDSMWCLITRNAWINEQVDVGVQTDQPKLYSKEIQTEFPDLQENEDSPSEGEEELKFKEEYE